MGDLQSEKENLTSFLQFHLKVSVSQVEDKLRVDSENVFVQELQHLVTKFVYHRDLNGTHWDSVEGANVKITGLRVSRKKRNMIKSCRIKPLLKAGTIKRRVRFGSSLKVNHHLGIDKYRVSLNEA